MKYAKHVYRLLGLLATAGSAAHAATYSMLDLGTVGGQTSSVGKDINELGDVLAMSNGAGKTLSFVYKSGVKTTLPGLTGEALQESNASSLNVLGQSVGIAPKFVNPFYVARPFIEHKAGDPLVALESPISPTAAPAAINDVGNQAGTYSDSSSNFFAYFYAGGNRLDLGTLGGVQSAAYAMNTANKIVGWADITNSLYRRSIAYLYQNGGMQNLGNNGSYDSSATDVNDQGWVVGTYHFTDNFWGSGFFSQTRPFLFKGGQMFDFALSPNAVSEAKANGLNNNGQVVGSEEVIGDIHQATIYENNRIFNLNSQINQDLVSEWYIADAADINNLGQIVATIHNKRTNTNHAVLLNPWDGNYVTKYPNMYFRGTPNAWAAQRMTKVADNTWQTTINISATGTQYFKFDASGNWSIPLGEIGAPDGIAEQSSSASSIAITTGQGDYRIILNDLTRKYSAKKLDSCIYDTMFYRGTTNGWGKTAMTCVGFNTWKLSVTFASASDQLKFDVNGNWTTNYGDTGADNYAELSGPNILASSLFFSASYPYTTEVFFNEKTKHVWVGGPVDFGPCAFPILYIRGTLNNWGTVPMACEGPHLYQAELSFDGIATPQFKFDASGNWTNYFGDNNADGVADISGAPINLPGPGRYRITYNDSTRVYTKTLIEASGSPACQYPSMFVRGTLNNWALTPLRCIATNIWEVDADVAPHASKRFKFDMAGDWTTSWGDNPPLGSADTGGADIALSSVGRYRFRFNDNTKSYTVTFLGAATLPSCVNPTMYFRGTPGNFAPKAMTCVRNNEWEISVAFGTTSNERFKFDLTGNWATNWGDNNLDGFADLGGADIRVLSGGVYRVKFNEQTRFYQITQLATP